MNCDQFADLFELYAAGSIDRTDSEALRNHLESGCGQCGTRVDEAILQAALISATVPFIEPPPALRDRIAASVQAGPAVLVMPERRRALSYVPWLVAAAAITALVGAIGFEEVTRQKETASLSASLESANSDAQRTAQMLTILQAPGTRQVDLNLTKADLPQGRLFIHKNLGVAMVVSNMPAAPEGWKYESWIVPKSGAPRPVESFATNKAGVAVTVVKGPVDVSQWAALAVSMEPANSTPVKPTKVLFAAPV